MIWIIGDTHGDWVHRLNMDSFPEQKEMTKDDYVIICGDFGIWNDSSQQRWNLNWLEERNNYSRHDKQQVEDGVQQIKELENEDGKREKESFDCN